MFDFLFVPIGLTPKMREKGPVDAAEAARDQLTLMFVALCCIPAESEGRQELPPDFGGFLRVWPVHPEVKSVSGLPADPC